MRREAAEARGEGDERPGAWAWLSQDTVQLVTQDLAELTSLGKVLQVCPWLLPEGGQGSARSRPGLLQAPTAYEERTKVEKERDGKEEARQGMGTAAELREGPHLTGASSGCTLAASATNTRRIGSSPLHSPEN